MKRFREMKKIQFLKVGDYMKTITRTKYLDRIIELNGTPDIKIITGIRRSGKSKQMQAYLTYLKSNLKTSIVSWNDGDIFISAKKHHEPVILFYNFDFAVHGIWTGHDNLSEIAVYLTGNALSLACTLQEEATIERRVCLHIFFQQKPQKMDEPIG